MKVVDRARALQHFGDESVMQALMQRFPETVSGTLCRLQAAWLENRTEDLRCHIYQMRGAASWVCADRLLSATEDLMRAYHEHGCSPNLQPQVDMLVKQLECVNLELSCPPGSPSDEQPSASAQHETGHAPEAGTLGCGGRVDALHRESAEPSTRVMDEQIGRLTGQLNRLDRQLERHVRVRGAPPPPPLRPVRQSRPPTP